MIAIAIGIGHLYCATQEAKQSDALSALGHMTSLRTRSIHQLAKQCTVNWSSRQWRTHAYMWSQPASDGCRPTE